MYFWGFWNNDYSVNWTLEFDMEQFFVGVFKRKFVPLKRLAL